MSRYEIRQVDEADVEQLAAAHVEIWKVTYPGMADQAMLDALAPRDRIEFWQQIVADRDFTEAQGLRTRCAVDTLTSKLVGFATGGTPRGDDPPADVELWSLNILPEHHGAGIAVQLMNAVVGADSNCFLWMATGNDRALAFYRRHGFDLDGVTRFDDEWDCHESRLVRP